MGNKRHKNDSYMDLEPGFQSVPGDSDRHFLDGARHLITSSRPPSEGSKYTCSISQRGTFNSK